ncbi:MAG: dual specificity protein phosphatase family protein [Gammaproteobacteria bacterium]|nr:dual specificity protein phosphatase family protein [Gammaproteobacteria bacterium]
MTDLCPAATLVLSPLALANGATLAFHPCPGKDGAAEADLQVLLTSGAAAVVSLVNDEELAMLGVADLGERLQAAGIRWFHLPIEDDHAPDAAFEQAWLSAGPAIHALLEQGSLVTIHCRGGTGRTGLIAARLLLERGMSLADASAAVKALRPKALGLPVHIAYIEALVARLSGNIE